MTANVKTIAELAKELNIAESTARRWAKQLSDFLPSQHIGRAVKYQSDAKDILKEAARLFHAGYTANEVYRILAENHTRTLIAEPIQDKEKDSQMVATVNTKDNIPSSIRKTLKALIKDALREELAIVEEVVERDGNMTRTEVKKHIETITLISNRIDSTHYRVDEVFEKLKHVERLSKERVKQVDEALQRYRQETSVTNEKQHRWWQFWR